MPYELPLSNALKQWKVKILDKETLYEEPHVTIVFKSNCWRFSLRRMTFMDSTPPPSEVPSDVVERIRANRETLHKEWDKRFPTNPITQSEEEK